MVYPLTAVVLAPFTAVCINTPSFAFTGGTPSGGVYSGPGVTGENLSPSIAGIGNHTITYTYTNINGCITSDSKLMTVNPLPGTPGAITGLSSMCQGSSPSTYSVSLIADATTYLWSVTPVICGKHFRDLKSVHNDLVTKFFRYSIDFC